MASSPTTPQLINSSSKQPYFYFIIVGMILIVLIVLIANAFAGGCCVRIRRFFSGQTAAAPPSAAVQGWIPASKYGKEEADVECAVCLSAITDGEMVRELPQCGHTFHVACIDLWFRSHASCPVCRSIVLSTPPESMEMLASGMDGMMMMRGFV